MQKTIFKILLVVFAMSLLICCIHADENDDSPEWVNQLPQAKNESVNQLFIVAGIGMNSSSAAISMHERDAEGHWKQVLSTPGFIGKEGLCLEEEHSEDTTATPMGVYKFNRAFGIADDPGCAISYFKVNNSTYWSGDEAIHYNEMVDINVHPKLNMTNSEHILDYQHQYRYCLNINFNENGTPGKGSAIFLHCFDPIKPYTGGCVAVPENVMVEIMRNVNPDCVVVIDTVDNLNVTFN